MIKGKKKLTLLTGATSGIGFELAHKLNFTDDLILVGRKPKSEVLNLLPSNISYIQTDLSDAQQAVNDIEEALSIDGIMGLDQVIHCAGIGYYVDPADETLMQVSNNISVNLLFPILLTRQLAARMEAVSGKLILIGSVAHKGSPKMAGYAASKAGLAGFARSLEAEWRGRISVQIIHPGPTLTPMLEKAGYSIGFERHLFLSPQVMASEMINIIKTNKKVATVFLKAKLKSLLPWSAK